MKIKLVALCIGANLLCGSLACSNIALTGNNQHGLTTTITARTMDLEYPIQTNFALGLKSNQALNTSNLNLNTTAKPIQWKNQHNYLGQASNSPNIVDGINDAGVYIGLLYLPHFTKYPTYNPNDSRPALGINDLTNYVLATSKSVNDAINHLEKLQIIANASNMLFNTTHVILPLHFIIRDQSGDSAAIEFVNGQTKIYHQHISVLTNAPTLDWQTNNATKYDNTFNGSTDQQADGVYLNGSGFNGIPGDWTPPSRFARATQIIRNIPTPHNRVQAIALAKAVINSIAVPIGTNPAPTLWVSMADLTHHMYYFENRYRVIPSLKKGTQKFSAINSQWKAYQVDKINSLPWGWLNATITPTAKLDRHHAIIIDVKAQDTKPNIRTKAMMI